MRGFVCRITKIFKILSTKIIFLCIPVFSGIFLFYPAFPLEAKIIMPSSNVQITVKDAITNNEIPNVEIKMVMADIYGDCADEDLGLECVDGYIVYSTFMTNELGVYTDPFFACWENTLYINHEGYDTKIQTINVPCWTSFPIDIFLEPEIAQINPVIIIPGIMASWNRNLLDENIEYADQWELDPHFHTYDGLIADLQTYGGYVLNEKLFPFPYDWRQSNEFTAQLLHGKIQSIKQQTGAQKVDIVAHSMGGLVARQYIESDLYQNDIDQLIFIATPQRGAPKAYLAWEGGYLGTTIVSDFVKELLVAKIAKIDGYCDSLLDRNKCVYEYIRGYPVVSLQQLLPDYDYLRSVATGDLFVYPNAYPRNEFLENLNASANLDKLYNSGIEISTIYNATPDSTVGEINVVDRTTSQEPFWEHGYPDGFSSFFRNNGISKINGDGTVPYESSIYLDSLRQISKLNTDHSNIVGIASQNIIEILKKEFIDIQVIDQPDEYVIIQVHSPVDILLTLPSGQQIGSTSTGDIVDVQGAYYSGSDAQNEYIILPKNELGNYNLTLVGTGEDEYQIDISVANNENVDTQSFVGNITSGVTLELETNVSENTISPIEPIDKIAPTISIVSPTSTVYEHNQLVPIDFSLSDEGSGIATSSVYIDNILSMTTSMDLFIFSLGNHELRIHAGDWAGNNQELTVEFTVIASFASCRTDIERLFAQGDIRDIKTKKLLLKEVDWLEKSYEQLEKFINKNHLPGVVLSRLREQLAIHMVTNTLDKLINKNLISPTSYDILKEQFLYIINN